MPPVPPVPVDVDDEAPPAPVDDVVVAEVVVVVEAAESLLLLHATNALTPTMPAMPRKQLFIMLVISDSFFASKRSGTAL
jgi:hypothetical protein